MSVVPSYTWRRTSTFMNNTTNINDLPDLILADVICRLPDKRECSCQLSDVKHVVEYKLVCKRWRNLISKPYIRFRCLQNDKVTPIQFTLIDNKGRSFLPMRAGPYMLPMFKQLRSLCGLKAAVQPIVIATHNDLILCGTSEYFQRYYYICNPYTGQCVALPPTLSQYETIPVGFMINGPTGRCVVVRIPPPEHEHEHDHPPVKYDFKVEIFSSETGEWRESVVSSPRGFRIDDIDWNVSYAHDGRLYWKSNREARENFLIRLDPFKYECCFWEFDGADLDQQNMFRVGSLGMRFGCLGVYDGGSPSMWNFDRYTNTLFVWELKKEGIGKLCVKQKRAYPLDSELFRGNDSQSSSRVKLLDFDPNKEDSLCLSIGTDIFSYDMASRRWLKTEEKSTQHDVDQDYYLFPLVVSPWWRTPIPTLPHLLHAPAVGRKKSFCLCGFLRRL